MNSRVTVGFLVIFLVAACVLWAGSPVTIIDDVKVCAIVADDEVLLQDGRRLFLRRSIADPETAVGQSIRIIATIDPQGTGMDLTSASILRVLERTEPDRAKSGSEFDVEGAVTALGVRSFELSTQEGLFQVVVDEATEYHDLEGLDDLEVGDAVRVKGDLEGSVVTAEEVRLLDEGDDGDGDGDGEEEEDPSGVFFESIGQVVGLPDGQRIHLDDLRLYDTDDGTLYSDGLVGYDDLRLGMMVKIEAVREASGVNRALEVKLESEEDGVSEFEGVIQSVDLTGFLLIDGPRVEVVASTVFDGDADRLADLEPGWSVEVKAYQDLGGLTALEVEADDPEVASVEGEEFEPQQALVVLAAGAVPGVVADRYDAVVLGEIGGIAVLLWWEEEIDDQLLALMDSDPEIAAVEPNYLFRDPESVRRRYVVVDREHHDWEYSDQIATSVIRLATAQMVADGEGSVIAVLDTGVDPGHPALAGRILDGGLDLVDGDTQPWETRDGLDQDADGDIDEAAGHGTFVSSLVLLVAPKAKILPYRVLDDDGGGSAYQLSLALADAIARQVDVISLSLVYRRRSAAVDMLLEQAGAHGIVVVAAAGNEGLGVLPFPASDRHTLAVTGMTADGEGLATFANRSPEAWLAGPSEEIYGAVDGGRWGAWSGTSMAVPFVAGALAVLRQIDPELDLGVFAELLAQSGRPLTDGAWNGMGLNLGGAVQQLASVEGRRSVKPAELR